MNCTDNDYSNCKQCCWHPSEDLYNDSYSSNMCNWNWLTMCVMAEENYLCCRHPSDNFVKDSDNIFSQHWLHPPEYLCNKSDYSSQCCWQPTDSNCIKMANTCLTICVMVLITDMCCWHPTDNIHNSDRIISVTDTLQTIYVMTMITFNIVISVTGVADISCLFVSLLNNCFYLNQITNCMCCVLVLMVIKYC